MISQTIRNSLPVAVLTLSFVIALIPSSIHATCSTSLFECLDEPGKCIPKTWMCDGKAECNDGSDESPEFCDIGDKEACNSTLVFKCPDGNCISSRWVCDGRKDCANGEDEKRSLCPERECGPDFYRCSDGSGCVPQKFVCDDMRDCANGEDELGCASSKRCADEDFACADGEGLCVPKLWLCDGKRDCRDGSDEMDCLSRNCSAAEFRCGDGKCINAGWVCDQSPDCDDGSDEKGCPEPTCDSNEEFMCSNGRCVPIGWHCDGEADCLDASDEKNCPLVNSSSAQVCKKQEWKCKTMQMCIHSSWVCDGSADCEDKSDEDERLCKRYNSSCRADQFKCGDGSCIPSHLQCNGKTECNDGADEKNCKVATSMCDPGKEFACGTGPHCVPLTRVCDGTKDCPDGSDEPAEKCNVDECAIHNGGCQHTCVNTKTGFRCECPAGYKLSNSTHCEDIDECQVWGTCSQSCLNFEGSYKCECYQGYTKDLTNPNKCRVSEGGNPELMFANVVDIRKLQLNGDSSVSRDMALVAAETRSATALDYAHKLGLVFWSDVNDHRIYRTKMGDPVSKVPIITQDIDRADGLAVDWVHETLYWTSSGKNKIEVSRLDGSDRKTLFRGEAGGKPRAIVVVPSIGWLYWSDWGMKPRIERLGMDGTHREIIVRTGSGIEWPNGLAVDQIGLRLFWVDAKLHQISSSNLDGSDRRIIMDNAEFLLRPFSISVFEDNVFWSDWEKRAIFKASKFNGSDLVKLTPEQWGEKPNVIQVYHSHRQMESLNFCGDFNGYCSHLCLPAPQFHGDGAWALSLASKNSLDSSQMHVKSLRRKRSMAKSGSSVNHAEKLSGFPQFVGPKKYSCACPDGLQLEGDFQCYLDGKPVNPVSIPFANAVNGIKVQPEDEDGDDEDGVVDRIPDSNLLKPDYLASSSMSGTGEQVVAGVSGSTIAWIVCLVVLVTMALCSLAFVAVYEFILRPKHGIEINNPAYMVNRESVSIEQSSDGSPTLVRKSYKGEHSLETLQPLNRASNEIV